MSRPIVWLAHYCVCSFTRNFHTNEPPTPANEPNTINSQANPWQGCSKYSVSVPANPTNAPPANEAANPKPETPPFVPGGTFLNRVIKMGQSLFKMPNSLAHFTNEDEPSSIPCSCNSNTYGISSTAAIMSMGRFFSALYRKWLKDDQLTQYKPIEARCSIELDHSTHKIDLDTALETGLQRYHPLIHYTPLAPSSFH